MWFNESHSNKHSILGLIPMPVLFGVFLFMGVSSLKGLQFVERLLLLFIPRKYQPEYVYLKYVPLYRVHLFTLIQLSNLVFLWVIKSNPTTSIAFPGISSVSDHVTIFHYNY